MAETLVLLHGFAGTRRSWDAVAQRLPPKRYRPLALDLRGHGDARDARPIDVDACVADVLAAAPERFALCGYSMGGRIALRLALEHPQRVTALALVATSAGLIDAQQRERRRAEDEALAAVTEGDSIDGFARRWMALELFAGTPATARALWHEDILRNDPRALAAALRGLGPGTAPSSWERLAQLAAPALVLVGARDRRYLALGERMARTIPNARLVVVPGAGHGLPREAPAQLAAALTDWTR